MVSKKKPRVRINTKRKGNRNELKTKKLLESTGYRGVKSGGSLGEFDLVMLGSGSLRLIQVKSNRRPPPAEREAISEFPIKTGETLKVSKEIWVWKDYAREPLIEIVK